MITHIDVDDYPRNSHRVRYHVATKACNNGNPRGIHGYTFDSAHHDIIRISQKKVPQFIIDDSKSLIGDVSTHLL